MQQRHFAQVNEVDFEGYDVDFAETYEKGHGRIESRLKGLAMMHFLYMVLKIVQSFKQLGLGSLNGNASPIALFNLLTV